MEEKTFDELKIADIMRLLPHRYPFLLVDRVTEIIPNEKVVAYKNLTYNEQFFQGHFPNAPVMPGVLIIEAMAQTGIILVVDTLKIDTAKENMIYLLPVLKKPNSAVRSFQATSLSLNARICSIKCNYGKWTAKPMLTGSL